MKAFLRKTLLFISLFIVAAAASMAQRVVKGTVYMDGEPAAGVTVEVHKGGSMMTSFDGLYEVEADAKSKYIKFTFIDETQKLEIEDKSGDTFDHAFTGSIPSGDAEVAGSGDVNLKSAEELIGEGNKDFMQEYSLYDQFYKQGDFKSALPHWKILYSKYPKFSPNIYIQGAKMYESFIKKASAQAEKDKLFKDYMKIYDNRIKYFGQKGKVLGRKGTALLKFKLEESDLEGEVQLDALKSGYEWVNESVNELGNETELPVLVLLMQTSRSLFKLGAISKETMVINYEKCSTIVNSVIGSSSDATMLKNAKDVQIYIEDIFGKSGAADCEALVSIFSPQFEKNGTDVEFIKGMLRKLRRAKCDESSLYENATERLYELEPSAEAAFNMAHRYLKLEDFEKAKSYYKQAMDQETDQKLLATYYYEYAYFIYAKESALAEARGYARKALSINPNYCEANLLIGDIYVAASSGFDGDNFEKRTIFWLATDYFVKARRGVDCSLDAANKISTYKKHFPNKEEAFMRDLKDGAPYKIGGWINETTKARF
jgi:tetratricopeptide (TPR) repeat protein